MRRLRRPAGQDDEEHVPWASFADAMAGLVFVFILLTLKFAYDLSLKVDEAEQEKHKVVTRQERANTLARSLVALGGGDAASTSVAMCLSERHFGDIQVRPVPASEEARASLYLFESPRNISIPWFGTGQADLSGSRCEAARAIGSCLANVLEKRSTELLGYKVRVFVEGHTDASPLNGAGVLHSNWELSAARAASVIRAVMVPYERSMWTPDVDADTWCSATNPGDVERLTAGVADGRLDVIAVGLAQTKPAWRSLCDEIGDEGESTVCGCLNEHAGNASPCRSQLERATAKKARSASELLILWGNQDGARKAKMRRVDLRFEVTPRDALASAPPLAEQPTL